MKLAFRIFKTVALVASLSLPAFAGEPRRIPINYNSAPVVCHVNEDESYCFANATRADSKILKLVCAKVSGRCPAAPECLADPTDADAQMQALASYAGENPDECDQFAARPAKPPVGGGMGGAAGPGR